MENQIRQLSELKNLANDYILSEEANAVLKMCFAEITALEQDIHRHIFLENNILFRKVIGLEKSLKKTALAAD
jgi:regulator of cell morphogenesis and NO signaling